ncbi:GPR1/FUN34/yaaH family-domain-containing protein [Xylaria bambusicola]|uniref:GPR1/FUN34/yaaH family-domain-containing protein n=1 Tax=Xylaria bambusicola TaxID=326684 RepID=UPI002007B6AE|nr:GPR1/FUN34/yaaH family-domain-containing protein [Xylaria bambusicola]KAI0517756.1 GPR1/FUN34/yaaH family-domain-containing protein [Xylaria bambusicola]
MAGSGSDVTNNHDVEKGLHRTDTAVTMPPELFEKLYLTPKVPKVGDYNLRFANPTALGFVGFVISTFTFSMVLMGWGGSEGFSPVVGIFFFTGPLLLTFTMVFEWVMGNFFPMMVMGLFSVFWLSFGVIQLPTLNLSLPYATSGDPTGATSPAFNTDVGLYLLVWGFALFTFFIFTLKINTVFALIFGLVSAAAWILSAAYFKVAAGDFETAGKLQKAGGALLFVVAALGWYMTFIIMAGEMRITLNLPVGDLSRFWPRTDIDLAAAAATSTREHGD